MEKLHFFFKVKTSELKKYNISSKLQMITDLSKVSNIIFNTNRLTRNVYHVNIIINALPSRFREMFRKWSYKDCKSKGDERIKETVSSIHNRTETCMNIKILQQHAQGLNRFMPDWISGLRGQVEMSTIQKHKTKPMVFWWVLLCFLCFGFFFFFDYLGLCSDFHFCVFTELSVFQKKA